MIILKERCNLTNEKREQLEEELSNKLGEKVVILPGCVEVVKDLNGELKRTAVELVDCNLRITKALKDCIENKVSGFTKYEIENLLFILGDIKEYMIEKDW